MEKGILTEKEVIAMLKGIRGSKRELLRLEFEIKNFRASANDRDVIEDMNFHHEFRDGISDNKVTDKTVKIALDYKQRHLSAMRDNEKQEAEYRALLVATNRLEYYIQLLDMPESELMSKVYIDGIRLFEVRKQMSISEATGYRLHKKAVKELTSMLNRLLHQ